MYENPSPLTEQLRFLSLKFPFTPRKCQFPVFNVWDISLSVLKSQPRFALCEFSKYTKDVLFENNVNTNFYIYKLFFYIYT